MLLDSGRCLQEGGTIIVTAEQIDNFHHRTVQALIYAEGLVAEVNQLRTADIVLPPENIWKRPWLEVFAENVAATGFMLTEELDAITSSPLQVTNALAGAHLTVVEFVRSVHQTLRHATSFDRIDVVINQNNGKQSKRTESRPRPATEDGWQALAKEIAPYMLSLKEQLKDIRLPGRDRTDEALRVEVRDAKRDLDARIRQEHAQATLLATLQAAQKRTAGKRSHSVEPIPRGNSGAPITTEEQAKFAISRLRSKPKPKWAAIVLEWNQAHADDRVQLNNLRGAVRRYEQRQARKQAANKPTKRKAAGKKRT